MSKDDSRLFVRGNAESHSNLKDFFSVQSAQKVVRDDVAFAPARDPNSALLNASKRFDAGRSIVSANTPRKQTKVNS